MGDMPYMLAMMLSMLCPLILGAAVKMLDGDMWTRGLMEAGDGKENVHNGEQQQQQQQQWSQLNLKIVHLNLSHWGAQF